jgi:hypothetical protein
MSKRIFLVAPLMVVALACNKKSGDSSNAAASASASAAAAAKPAPPPSGDVTLTCFVSAQASTEQKSHPAAHAFDEDVQTAWNDSAPDGTGQWVETRLRPGTFVDHVDVGGGWSASTSDGKTDLWPLNSSYKTMHVTWEGGAADVQFNRATDRGVKKSVPIGTVTTFVRFTATAVDRGKYADLCLDDAIVFGSCAADCDGPANACADTMFVQLAIPQPTTAETYDYPLTRTMLKGHPDFVGARVVEVTRNGQRVMGAVVKNRCQADAIVRLARAWDIIQPTAMCEKLTVRREVWPIDAAMAALPRTSSAERPKPPATGAAHGDDECKRTNGASCGAGMICIMNDPNHWGPNHDHLFSCVKDVH